MTKTGRKIFLLDYNICLKKKLDEGLSVKEAQEFCNEQRRRNIKR